MHALDRPGFQNAVEPARSAKFQGEHVQYFAVNVDSMIEPTPGKSMD